MSDVYEIDLAPRYTLPVQLTVPGRAEPMSVPMVFQHLGTKAFNAWIASGERFKDQGGDAAFLAVVLVDWRWSRPFSVQALDELLDAYQHAGDEIFSTYTKARSERRTGN